MATDLDRLPLPAFEDCLWQELAALHRSGRPRKSRGPSRFVLLAAAAAVTVLVASAAAVVLAQDHGSSSVKLAPVQPGPGPDEAATSTSAPASPTSTELVPVTGSEPMVFHTEQRNGGGLVNQSWVDEATGRRRDLTLDASGNAVHDSGWTGFQRDDAGNDVIATRTVDYSAGTYKDGTWTPPGPLTDQWHHDDEYARRRRHQSHLHPDLRLLAEDAGDPGPDRSSRSRRLRPRLSTQG